MEQIIANELPKALEEERYEMMSKAMGLVSI